ncbi:flippase-like domain-containing protein [Candidatus Daviesbacteria bacterium]|nr:flippase-like domain-containing protein [Candidatus Daviesbacteria bacterium]
MIKISINTLFGLVLIFVWSRFVDLGQILTTISKVNILSLAPAFFFMLLSHIIRAVRLKVFLSEVKSIPLRDLIYLNGVAQMLNFFIPVRAGEIAKGIYLSSRYNLNLGKSVTWIFIDRFVDFLVVLMLASVLLLIVPTALGIKFIIIITIILAITLSLTYLAIFQMDFTKKIINFLRPLLIEKHIKLYFDRFSNFILQSFSILNRHPRDLILMIMITLIAYGLDAAIWYLTFISLESPQTFLKMYLGQLLSALTYLIPAAPGYVGSAEASGLLILSGVFEINPNLASSMIVLFHIITAMFILIIGLISLFSLKMDLGLILKKAFRKRNLEAT